MMKLNINYVEILKAIITISCFIIVFKTIFIGGDFSIYYFYKYKRYYLKWYRNRETFQEFMQKDGDNYKEK